MLLSLQGESPSTVTGRAHFVNGTDSLQLLGYLSDQREDRWSGRTSWRRAPLVEVKTWVGRAEGEGGPGRGNCHRQECRGRKEGVVGRSCQGDELAGGEGERR